MPESIPSLDLIQRIRTGFRGAFRRLLHLWVKSTCVPDAIEDWGIDPSKPVFYVLDTYTLTSVLILDEVLEKAGLPLASRPFEAGGIQLSRSFGANRRYEGLFVRTLKKRRHSAKLKALIQQITPEVLEQNGDLQLVPVSVLVGRAPDKEASLFKVLFSENWGAGGRLRRLISTFVHGRHTLVQLGQPMTLEALFAETKDPEQALARISRVMRVYFKRVRSSAIGPDHSHLRTLIDGLIRSEPVETAIVAKARRDQISEEKARGLAYDYAKEIAANYSYTFILIANKILTWFLYRIFRGVEVKHFQGFRPLAPAYEVVYVPCHRSHIDYLLLSYILYHRGLMPPHVAAGVNLNLPFVGSLIRRGGGFFLRRSFRSKPLYAAVFNEYVAMILSKGVSLEYFIEGGRSRTGRLLPPKVGMLAMTVRAFLAQQKRPILFQPVSIAYERLAEGDAYLAELSGQQKKPESLSDFRNVFNIIRRNYGEVTVSFGEPLFLDNLLDQHSPNWRGAEFDASQRSEWVSDVVDELAQRILVHINQTAHINPVSLLSIAVLSTPKPAWDEGDLIKMLTILKTIFSGETYSDRITITQKSPQEIIDYGIELGLIDRQAHQSGPIVSADEKTAVLMAYFRNNAAHLLAMSAWVASCYLNLRRIKRVRLHELTRRVYPFMQNELFLPWPADGLDVVVDETIETLVAAGLLAEDQGHITRTAGGATSAHLLRLLANTMSNTFERYAIVIAVLVKNQSEVLTKQQLESLCMLCAQRLALLHPVTSPEFHDRTLFSQFVSTLQEQALLKRNGEGLLAFGQALEALSKDARLVLDREIYYTIVQSAPLLSELSAETSAASE